MVILWSHANIIMAELRKLLCYSDTSMEVAPYPFLCQQGLVMLTQFLL